MPKPAYMSERVALSVIVPLYNDESYICENLRSVLANAQDLELEIIVVNDGSTDGSLGAAETALAGSPVPHRIFTTENSGLSAARNFGLSKAAAPYVAFLDSDDFMAPGAYRAMVDLAVADQCAQVFARAHIHDAKTNERRAFYDFDIWEDILGDRTQRSFEPLEVPQVFRTQPKMCARIWSRDYLVKHGLSFPEGRVFEDIGVHLHSLALNGRVGVVNEAGLYYRKGDEGRITAQKGRARFDVIGNAREALQAPVVTRLEPRPAGYLVASLLRMVLWCRMGLPGDLKREFDQQVAGLSDVVDHRALPQAYALEPKVIRRFLLTTIRYGKGRARLGAFVDLVRAMIGKRSH